MATTSSCLYTVSTVQMLYSSLLPLIANVTYLCYIRAIPLLSGWGLNTPWAIPAGSAYLWAIPWQATGTPACPHHCTHAPSPLPLHHGGVTSQPLHCAPVQAQHPPPLHYVPTSSLYLLHCMLTQVFYPPPITQPQACSQLPGVHHAACPAPWDRSRQQMPENGGEAWSYSYNWSYGYRDGQDGGWGGTT